MTALFLNILSMSLTASYCICFVCLVRLLLRKSPKIFSYVLWSVVAFRLICPVSFESPFSLMGEGLHTELSNFEMTDSDKMPQIFQADDLEALNVNDTTNFEQGNFKQSNSTQSNFTQSNFTQDEPTHNHFGEAEFSEDNWEMTYGEQNKSNTIYLNWFTYLWLTVTGLLVGYSIFSFQKLRKKLQTYAHKTSEYQNVDVWSVTGLDTPFVLGLLHPAIYMPENLNELDCMQCLAHEYTHIRRKDYLIKQFSFWLACIHWFNPLVWLAFYLMTNDMEMSCDEVALRSTSLEDRRGYCGTLLELSTANKYFNGCPLAFGSNNTKARIKNIMNYKNPGFWAMSVAVILVIAAVVGLAANPKAKQTPAAENAGEMIHTADAGRVIHTVPVTEEMTIADYYSLMLTYRQKYMEALSAIREKGYSLNESVKAGQQQYLREMESYITLANAELNQLQLTPSYTQIQGTQYRLFAKISPTSPNATVPVCDTYTDIADITAKKISMPEKVYNKLVIKELQQGDIIEILHYGSVSDVPEKFTEQYALICWEPWNKSEENCGYISIDCLNLNVSENTAAAYLLAAGNYLAERNRLISEPQKKYLPLQHISIKNGENVVITYYEQTVHNTIVNHKQELSLTSSIYESGNINTMADLYQNYVSAEVMTAYGNIRSTREFITVFGMEPPYAVFDYHKSGLALLLKEQRESAQGYANPITALENYLHLENGSGIVLAGDEADRVSVAYTFADGYTITVPMFQLTDTENLAMLTGNLNPLWCIDIHELNKSGNWNTIAAVEINDSETKQQLLNIYTEYLNNRENTAFVTKIYHGNQIDLDMLLYDSTSMLENAPLEEGELELLIRENINEKDILYHYTGFQIDKLLREKMNLSLADVCYRNNAPNTLKSDAYSSWVYLEAFDSYTLPAKGDCLLEDIVCTDIKQLYNGGILINYKSAESTWIKNGLLYMCPKSSESKITSPEDFYFYGNQFIEGGYHDNVIFSE